METSILARLQKEKAKRLQDGLYHETQIKFAYNSNCIRGSTLTEEQTRQIYDTNTMNASPNEVVHIDDIIETVNHFACFDYMLDTADEELSEELIKDIHRILKTGTSDFHKETFMTGDYKSLPSLLDGVETTPPEKVAAEMGALLDAYLEATPIDFSKIIDYHCRFEKIHPFQDGNGRVGRIILFRECLKNDIVPLVIEFVEKPNYYQGLKEYDTSPDFLMKVCQAAQEKYKELMGE